MAQSQILSNSSEHQHVQIINRKRHYSHSSRRNRKENDNYLFAHGHVHVNGNRKTKNSKHDDRILVHLIDENHLFKPAEKRGYLSAKGHINVEHPWNESKGTTSFINHPYVDFATSEAKPNYTGRPADDQNLDESRKSNQNQFEKEQNPDGRRATRTKQTNNQTNVSSVSFFYPNHYNNNEIDFRQRQL